MSEGGTKAAGVAADIAPHLRTAGACLQRGDAAGALAALGAAEAADPASAEVALNQALAWRMAGNPQAGIAALDRLLRLQPDHAVALLSKGALLEQVAGTKAAARVYRSALRHFPDGAKLPAALMQGVARARDLVADDAAQLQAFLRTQVAALRGAADPAALRRFDESLDVYAGAGTVPVQRPLLLHYTRLAAIPFYDRALFPFLPELEAATGDILAELQAVLASAPADFVPYIQFPPEAPVRQWGELNHSRRWSSYFLWKDGERQDEACARCPRTAALAERLPLMWQPGFAPTVVFSALEPRTRIPPHTGSANTRLLCHLPLVLPGPARFRVGPETRNWRLGEAWVFDDTIEHEAWNDADALRVILILDLWNPLITEAEKALVTAMMTARNAYYAA